MFLNKEYADSSDEEQIFSHNRPKISQKFTETPDWEQSRFSKRSELKSSDTRMNSRPHTKSQSKAPIPVRNYQIDLPPREDDIPTQSAYSQSKSRQQSQEPQLTKLPEHKQPIYLRKDWKDKMLGGDLSVSHGMDNSKLSAPGRGGDLSRSWVGGLDKSVTRDKYDLSNIPSKLIATDYERSTDRSRLSGRADLGKHSPIFRTEAEEMQLYPRKYHHRTQTDVSDRQEYGRPESPMVQIKPNRLNIETGVIQICLAPSIKMTPPVRCPNCNYCIKKEERPVQSSKSPSMSKASGAITDQLLKMVQLGAKQTGKSFQESSISTGKMHNRSSVEAPGNYLKPRPRQVLKDSSSINLTSQYDRKMNSGLDLKHLGGEKPIFRTDTDWRNPTGGSATSREQSKENLQRELLEYPHGFELKKMGGPPQKRSISPMTGADPFDRNSQFAQRIYYEKLKSSVATRKDPLVSDKHRESLLNASILNGSRDNLSHSHSLLQQSSKVKTGISSTNRVLQKGAGIR